MAFTDEANIRSYIHSDDYNVDHCDCKRCSECESVIGSQEWAFEIDGIVLCEDCLIPYMKDNYGHIE